MYDFRHCNLGKMNFGHRRSKAYLDANSGLLVVGSARFDAGAGGRRGAGRATKWKIRAKIWNPSVIRVNSVEMMSFTIQSAQPDPTPRTSAGEPVLHNRDGGGGGMGTEGQSSN